VHKWAVGSNFLAGPVSRGEQERNNILFLFNIFSSMQGPIEKLVSWPRPWSRPGGRGAQRMSGSMGHLPFGLIESRLEGGRG
jgi:hypothetical protein